MKINLEKPFTVEIEKFKSEFKKDDLDTFTLRKPLKGQFESLGYQVILGENFEVNLLVDFVKKYKAIDKYTKVKIGDFRPKKEIKEYNQKVIEILGTETIEKLLFLCRICSYISDPSFPDYLICKSVERDLGFRYSYREGEILDDKVFFIFLAKEVFDIKNIKFSTLDFLDFQFPQSISFNISPILERVLGKISQRVNIENSIEETGIDFSLLKKWIEKKEIEKEDFIKMYMSFLGRFSKENKLVELLEKLKNMDTSFLNKDSRQGKLMALVQALRINMLEAQDLLNLYEIDRL